MSATITAPTSASERLLEEQWEARDARASRRELAVEGAAGALLVLTAGIIAAAGGVHGLRPGLALALVAVYAVVACVEFPVGAGNVVPTQLVLVPMLVLLPPAVVPMAVVAGLVASSLALWATGHSTGRRVVSSVPDAWHAVGPAL